MFFTLLASILLLVIGVVVPSNTSIIFFGLGWIGVFSVTAVIAGKNLTVKCVCKACRKEIKLLLPKKSCPIVCEDCEKGYT